MDAIEQLRSARSRQKAAARDEHVEALKAAALAIAAGESVEPDEESELLDLLDKAGVSDEAFAQVVEIQRQLNAIAVPTAGDLAELKKVAASAHGTFWAAVQKVKKMGVAEPVRSTGFGVAVLYSPLKAPHAAMREAQKAVEQAERSAFKVAELEGKLAILLGERQAPTKPTRPQGGSRNIDDASKRAPEDPSVTGGKVLRRDRDGRPVVVVQTPVRTGDLSANVHVTYRQ